MNTTNCSFFTPAQGKTSTRTMTRGRGQDEEMGGEEKRGEKRTREDDQIMNTK